MPAQIYEDDLAVFYGVPWHRQGVILRDPLDWETYQQWVDWPQVHRRQLAYTNDNWHAMATGRTYEPIDDAFCIVSDNGHVLNPMIGPSRPVIQYNHMDDAVEAMLGTGLASGVVSAGTLNHGSKAYVTLEFGEPIDIPGYSRVNRWFTLTDAHDGSVAASGRSTVGVVVCANTFQAYVLGVPSAWSIRHTKNAELYIAEALAAFMSSAMQQRDIERAVDQLINSAYEYTDFAMLVNQIVPIRGDASDREREGREAVRHKIHERYWGGDLDSCRDTKWGALMAVQAYEQHESKTMQNSRTARQARHIERLAFGKLNMANKAAKILQAA